nr:hypothetical protein HmN_000711900 [Hymenolepis microstoma]
MVAVSSKIGFLIGPSCVQEILHGGPARLRVYFQHAISPLPQPYITLSTNNRKDLRGRSRDCKIIFSK